MRYNKGVYCQIPSLPQIYMDTFGYMENGFFVEVGAFDGIQWSNTSGLVEAGWSGIYFEPQTREFARLMANYEDNEKIILSNKALSNWHGSTRLFLGGSISTIHREMRDNYLKTNGAFAQTGLAEGDYEIVSVSTLDTELDWIKAPIGFEVLVIDVEGSEMDVLEGFSIDKYKPVMAIIETHEQLDIDYISEKSIEINAHMQEHGYEKIYSDYINSIYIKHPTPLEIMS